MSKTYDYDFYYKSGQDAKFILHTDPPNIGVIYNILTDVPRKYTNKGYEDKLYFLISQDNKALLTKGFLDTMKAPDEYAYVIVFSMAMVQARIPLSE